MILNVIDNSPRGYGTVLATIAGYDQSGGLTKVLNNEKKEFGDFSKMIDLVKFLFEDDEQSILESYSKQLNPCFQNARYMLEYLSCHRLLDSMKELIDRMLVCNNNESKEWAKVYSIHLNWQLNYHILDVKEYLEILKEVKTNISDLKAYVKLLKCHGFYLKKNHHMAFEISQDVTSEIDEIKEDYLRKAYQTKLNEIDSYVYLRVQNKPEEARMKAYDVIDANIGKTFNAYSHYTIGCSYFYQSYDKAKEHFFTSIDIYTDINRGAATNDVKEVYQLLNIVWDKEVTDIVNNDYKIYHILKNNLDIPFELNKDNIDLAYYYLLKGMQLNSIDMLMQSMIHFLKRGDSFFANLPKMELLKRNYSQVIINELINLHVA
jgi:hypothetical protein